MFVFLLSCISLLLTLLLIIFKKAIVSRRQLFIKYGNKAGKRARLISIGVVLTIFSLILMLIVGWFLEDNDFTFFVWMLTQDRVTSDDGYQDYGFDWTNPSTWGGGGGTSSLKPGYSGVNAMYRGIMSAGYYNEYLSITKEACLGGIVQDEFFNNYGAVFPSGRSNWKNVPIYSVMGINVAETGTNTDHIGPCQLMDVSKYNQETGYTLLNFNTNFVKAQGLSSLDNSFTLSTQKNGNGMRGPFQFAQSWFDVYPDKIPSKSNNARFAPASLNGYGFDSNTVRHGRTAGQLVDGQLDGAFYPDIAVNVTQYMHYNVSGAGAGPVDTGLTDDAFAIGAASMHYFGEGGMSRYVKGGTPAGMTRKTMATYAWNYTANLWTSHRDYAYAHAEDLGLNIYTQQNWQGWAATLLLLQDSAVHCSTCVSMLKSRGTGNTPFAKGALLAYRSVKGDSATQEQVIAFYNSLTANKPSYIDDSSFAHDTYTYAIYVKSDKTGDTGNPVWMRWEGITLQECGTTIITGPYAYQQVLALCGVEASLSDCCKDTVGNLIGKIKAPVSNDGVYIEPSATGADAEGNPLYQGPSIEITGDILQQIPTNAPANSYYWGTRRFRTPRRDTNALPKQNSVMYWRVLTDSVGIHFGEDFKYSENTEVGSVCDGVVFYTYRGGGKTGYGNNIRVRANKVSGDKSQIEFVFAHLNSVKRNVGDQVKEGDLLGLSGNTGSSTGPHLHLEMWVYESFRGKTECYCVSFGSIFNGYYTVASAPRVPKDEKRNETGCMVFSAAGDSLGLLSVVRRSTMNERCEPTDPENNGINYYRPQAIKKWLEYLSTNHLLR